MDLQVCKAVELAGWGFREGGVGLGSRGQLEVAVTTFARALVSWWKAWIRTFKC